MLFHFLLISISFTSNNPQHKVFHITTFQKCLIDLKTEVDFISTGMAPPFGHVFTKLCLDHGGDPNMSSASEGMTPVHMAVGMAREDTLGLLLGAGGK